MANVDWNSVKEMDQSARMTAFLRECMYGSIPVRQAAIVAALSVNESAMTPFMPNEGSMLPASCNPLRQILRQERGTDRSPFQRITARTKAYMTEKGYLKKTGSQYYLELDQSSGVDKLSRPLLKVQDAFEFGLANQDIDVVKLFSIGMTQMYLALSPIVGGSLPSRFPDWDSLWRFYTAQDVAALFSTHAFDYLSTTSADYPTESSSLKTVQKYLQTYHTGNVNWEDSNWAAYSASTQNNVKWAWQVCSQLGYR